MNISIKEMHNEVSTPYFECMKEIVEEKNPYTFLTLSKSDEASICSWIHEQTNSFHWAFQKNVTTYWILHAQDVIGIATIKKELSQQLYADSGNIGICIKKSKRYKGYGCIALKTLIEEAKTNHHLQDILLCCEYDNQVSRRLCERVGGVLTHEDSFVHYWISDDMKRIQDIK